MNGNNTLVVGCDQIERDSRETPEGTNPTHTLKRCRSVQAPPSIEVETGVQASFSAQAGARDKEGGGGDVRYSLYIGTTQTQKRVKLGI